MSITVDVANATTGNAGAGGTLSVAKPAGLYNNDLLVVIAGGTLGTIGAVLAGGFTLLQIGGGSNHPMTLCYRRIDGNATYETGPYTWAVDAFSGACACAFGVRGMRASAFDTWGSYSYGAANSDASVDAPSVLASRNSSLLVTAHWGNKGVGADGTATDPAGMTRIKNVYRTSDAQLLVCYQLVGTGNTGVKTAVLTGTNYLLGSYAEAALAAVFLGSGGGGWGTVTI